MSEARQRNNRQYDAGEVDALASFAAQAEAGLRELVAPLEILNNLIYLSKQHLEKPEKLRGYLTEAEETVQKVIEVYSGLLKVCPGRGRTGERPGGPQAV